MGSETTDEGLATSQTPQKTGKVESFRKQFLGRVLPVSMVPLLVLSVFTIGAVFFLQRQTVQAVDSAEELLTESVLQDSVARSSAEGGRELARYVDGWILRTERLVDTTDYRSNALQASSRVTRARLNPEADNFDERLDEITSTFEDPLDTTGTLPNRLPGNISGQLRTFEEAENVQFTLVTDDGIRIASNDDTALNDYSGSDWFEATAENGSWFRSYVNDGDGEPSFEMAFLTLPGPGFASGTILRVRVSMSNVQWLLDQISLDEAVTVTLIDNSAEVLLADTATDHAETLLFDTSMTMDDQSGLNENLLLEGTVLDDEFITAATEIAPLMDNEFVASFDWLIQTNQPRAIADASLADIRDVSDEVSRFRWTFTSGVIFFILLAAFWAYASVRSTADAIASPIKLLSDQAKSAAETGMPSIVEAARTSDVLPDLPEFNQSANEEIAVLASSLNTMQHAAVSLAAGQAKLRRQNVSRTFVSLGRRNQNLLNRQLEFITELEQQEQDPDLLENLFRLDHLATRMRRNAENLLVLAGEQTPRRWGRPIAVRDVLRAAASEIADYPRVRLGDIDPATVSGGLATDLSHLIAELLENAGSFSPPNTPIEVLGQHTATHYRLAIVDQGIGLDPQALAQVNERLKDPVDFADAPSAYLGMFVVSRLAQDMGITVRLASADPTGEGRRRGTIAFIDLPVALLSSEDATPVTNEGSEGAAARAGTLDAAQQGATPTAAPAPVAQAPAPQALPTPTPAPVSAGETSAGFPKRSRGATSVPLAPEVMSPSKPAVADVPAPQPAAAPAPAVAAVPPAAAPTPEVAAPATEITSAGFPKRGSSAPAVSAAPAPAAPSESAERIRRDPANVSASLQSVRAAVARGRASSGTEASAANPSQSAPVVPIAPTTQTPTAPVPVQPAQPTAAPAQPAPAPQPAPAAAPSLVEPTDQPTHPIGSE